MRFLENGPDIPDELLAAREAGRVVVFCGAGLSRPAGLPDFKGLTQNLLDRLGAVESRRSFDAGDSLDRVFSALVKEFGGAAVDAEVGAALRTPPRPVLRYHRIALELSRNLDSEPQIVTTNFDLLFERAERRVPVYVPPALPDLALLQPIRGVVYLHGRLADGGTATGRPLARAGYVISSGDFGRAYLAEGWAARFVRELRERFTIVLLGYSANDPPVRYLLEGLESSGGTADRSPIYTFAPGAAEEVAEEWRDRGVTAIAYNPLDPSHGGLWSSLEAWSRATTDPAGWRAHLLDLAHRLPAELRPFERGQVARLVSGPDGASAFASADPPPPAEWVCVLDAGIRYAKPARAAWTGDDDAEVDPLDLFGLDDDPPRPPERPGGGFAIPGTDLLRWRPGDDSWPERLRLVGRVPEWAEQLPPRLHHIARWLARVADQPAAVWWAARAGTPHPGLLWLLRERVRSDAGLPAPALAFWTAYFEAAEHRRSVRDHRSYEFDEERKAQGWTAATFRAFERLLRPFFEIGPLSLSAPCPPGQGWAELPLARVAEVKVGVSPWNGGTAIFPPEALPRIAAIVRRSLEQIAEMLDETTALFWRMPTLHPTGEPGENHHHGRKESLFLAFAEIMRALAAADPVAARREVDQWRAGERYFFAKLFLFAATLPGLVSAERLVDEVLGMEDEVLWDAYSRRELLFALRERWGDLDLDRRRSIERRIVLGRELTGDDDPVRRRRRRRTVAATMLRWLELNGRALTPRTAAILPSLAAAEKDWSDAWAWNAADSLGMRGGMIHRVTEPQGLERLRPAEVVEMAERLSTDDIPNLQDFRPFDGLVEAAPTRALLALRIEGRRGRWPGHFWRSLLSNWPEDAPKRAGVLLGRTLAALPTEPFVGLRHYIPDWVRQSGTTLAGEGAAGDRILDDVIDRFVAAPPAALESGVGFSTIGGVVQERSEVSISKAINSPGGKLADAVFDMAAGKLRRDRGFPRRVRSRIERLLRLPGDGAGHVACVVARRMSWLEYWDRKWAGELLPMFDVAHPLSEAMWHGLAGDRHLLSRDAQMAIKPARLRLLSGKAPWQLDRQERHHFFKQLVALCIWPEGDPVFTFEEIRPVLMSGGDDDRAAAIDAVAELTEAGRRWSDLGAPFLAVAWPRQLRFRSEAASRSLARLAEAAGDDYPAAVAAILPFVRPVTHLDVFTYRLGREDPDGTGHVRRHPSSVLALLNALVGDDRASLPWNLRDLLQALADVEPGLRHRPSWQRLEALTR